MHIRHECGTVEISEEMFSFAKEFALDLYDRGQPLTELVNLLDETTAGRSRRNAMIVACVARRQALADAGRSMEVEALQAKASLIAQRLCSR